MNNAEIAQLLDTVADMLAIRGNNFHRVNAYRKGADGVRGASMGMTEMAQAGHLTDLPGVGKTLATKITEIVETGKLEFYERLSKDVPPSLVDLLRIEGMGPKRVKLAYDKLGVENFDDLEKAVNAGTFAALPRVGAKNAAKVLANLQALKQHGDDRTPLGEAWPLARQMLAELAQLDGVVKSAVGGSLRRMRETIGDIDLLVGVSAGTDPAPIMDYFVNMPLVASVSGHGATKSSVHLQNGINADLRVLPAENWGTLLNYFTGSKAHNVRLRDLANKLGYSLNEYALTPLAGGDDILCATEEDVYARLGLPYILPRLREDRGEIDAALKGRLPKVVQNEQMIADLHMHSTWSDGKHTIREMAEAAKARGLKYIVITDHSQGLGIANGLTPERLWAQAEEVRAVDAAMGADFRVLHGTEMEIKADGSLDFPDDVLEKLDFVIASLHVSLKQSRGDVMRRLLNAIDNPHVDMIAHPTGRLIPNRQGADVDIGQLVLAASATGTILEINANPRRLDLRDVDVRRAASLGVKIAINSDAHHIDQLDLLHFGVATAQRGWVSAESVVNTWPLEKFLAYINK